MASTHDSLHEQLKQGGPITVDGSGDASLKAAAEALGYAVFMVDCGRAKSKSAVLRAIASAVDFPEFFGSNLDALLDCLTTTVLDQPRPGALVVINNLRDDDPNLAEHVGDIMDTFADAAEYIRDNGRVLAFARG